jgi:hypothetical protein
VRNPPLSDWKNHQNWNISGTNREHGILITYFFLTHQNGTIDVFPSGESQRLASYKKVTNKFPSRLGVTKVNMSVEY